MPTTPDPTRPMRPEDIERERSDWRAFYSKWEGTPGAELLEGFTEGGRLQEEEFRDLFRRHGHFEGKRVLEVGFGIGVLARLLRDEFPVASYVGIELTEASVANIQSESFPDSFRFEVCPAEEVGDRFPPKCFDIAVLHAVAHHFVDPAACFRSIAKVARELLALEPNRSHLFRRYLERKVNALPNQPVETSYTLWEWRGFLSAPGRQVRFSFTPYRLLPANVLNWRGLRWVPRPLIHWALKLDRRLVRIPPLRRFSYYLLLRAVYED